MAEKTVSKSAEEALQDSFTYMEGPKVNIFGWVEGHWRGLIVLLTLLFFSFMVWLGITLKQILFINRAKELISVANYVNQWTWQQAMNRFPLEHKNIPFQEIELERKKMRAQFGYDLKKSSYKVMPLEDWELKDTSFGTNLLLPYNDLINVKRIWPVLGRITRYVGYSFFYLPDTGFTGWGFHPGTDISCKKGTAISNYMDGVVTLATEKYVPWVGYGKHIDVQNFNGYSTIFGHLSKVFVTNGQFVKAGAVLGLSGDTGFSFGDHLHFEIRKNDKPFDPTDYLEFDKARKSL
jgi:murein DD-endopeptidase MepM/ murein hydrolase activator NlpD